MDKIAPEIFLRALLMDQPFSVIGMVRRDGYLKTAYRFQIPEWGEFERIRFLVALVVVGRDNHWRPRRFVDCRGLRISARPANR